MNDRANEAAYKRMRRLRESPTCMIRKRKRTIKAFFTTITNFKQKGG